MDPGTINTWLDLVTKLGLGLTVAALAVIWALYKGIITWGWYTKAVERERDSWRETALDGKVVLKKLVEKEELRA